MSPARPPTLMGTRVVVGTVTLEMSNDVYTEVVHGLGVGSISSSGWGEGAGGLVKEGLMSGIGDTCWSMSFFRNSISNLSLFISSA